jgi:Ni,Fe-hydrogenase III large subunit/Ni,Fe-hydrogenase III component G
MVKLIDLSTDVGHRWAGDVEARLDLSSSSCELPCTSKALSELCDWLFNTAGYSFAGLVVEEGASQWELRHVFYGEPDMGWVQVLVHRPLGDKRLPSIAAAVHPADWYEREVEDHFGLTFEGHPRLGDFVLHDDCWQEGLEPMRRRFNGHEAVRERRPNLNWQPRGIVHAPGSFMMPIGPVFAGISEPVHFLLETVGEDVIRTIPRLFYKYRGIEKIAEGRTLEDALLLAERFCGTSAIAHGLAFCQAAEKISRAQVPPRAERLRVFLAELERLRHHIAAIEAICESTALAVAASQTAILQEDLLRVSGALAGHRYLFGVLCVGGLSRDIGDPDCRDALVTVRSLAGRLEEIDQMLRLSSTFLDRIEEVGITARPGALAHGLVGPVARAAGIERDLRKAQPYCGYNALGFDVPVEEEGDGYARLRILFAEAKQSARLMEQVVATLPSGPVAAPHVPQPGAALGWVEAPRGAAACWLRIGEDARVQRYRIMPPSFMNWHGFHLAAENFAFQDFPIILATFDLSVTENDR